MPHPSPPPHCPHHSDESHELRERLRQRWPLPGDEPLREELLDAWGSPGRGYHDLQHLDEVLERLDELAPTLSHAGPTVALAAWFHDAVHDPEPDPEGRSAAWAVRALRGGDVDADEVARLVLLTREHSPAADDVEGVALCDADLAVLASGRERYRDYCRGVRQEYGHLDDATFAAGRAAVLRRFLQRPHLFASTHARERWEAAARLNVAREIAELSADGASDAAGRTP